MRGTGVRGYRDERKQENTKFRKLGSILIHTWYFHTYSGIWTRYRTRVFSHLKNAHCQRDLPRACVDGAFLLRPFAADRRQRVGVGRKLQRSVEPIPLGLVHWTTVLIRIPSPHLHLQLTLMTAFCFLLSSSSTWMRLWAASAAFRRAASSLAFC